MFMIQEMLSQYLRPDNDYLRIREALDSLGYPYRIVRYHDDNLRLLNKDFTVMSNSTSELELTKILANPFIIKGSVLLEKQLKQNTHNLIHQDFELDFSNVYDYVPQEYFLNKPFQTDYLKNIYPIADEFFLRPVKDNKSLTGQVYTEGELYALKQNYKYFNNYEDIENQLYMTSHVRHIVNEYRFFIVNHTISTSSTYMKQYKYETSPNVPDHVTEFANFIVTNYPTLPHVVLDIGELGNGDLKIIEYNTLSCSGLYDSNETKLLTDLNQLF